MDSTIAWNNLNWKIINYYVAKIKIKIYKSSKDKDFIRVRNFQKLLFTSNYYLLKCIEDTTNEYNLDIDKQALFLKLLSINIYKWNSYPGNFKNININSNYIFYDKIFQNMIKNILEPEWQAIIGFTYYSIKKTIFNLFKILKSKKKIYIFETKITGFLKLKFLKTILRKFPIKNLLLKWIKNKSIDLSIELKDLLLNICLFEIENKIFIKNTNIIRYKNELLIISENKRNIFYIKNILDFWFNQRGLKLILPKLINLQNESFQFIGFEFFKKKYIILIQPSINSKKKIIFDLSKIWKFHYGRPIYQVIKVINNYIIDCKNYYKFCNIDYSINLNQNLFGQALRFAKRTHPKKSIGWIFKKYFKKSNNNKFIYFDNDPQNGIIILQNF
uniref:Reverse transcriptase N-terminal domain-containing protein n=1 Tax=Dichotomosiphon tuberosus TaxID=118263 RepID=A0A386AWW6_9CHLO|nr:hypothetical protein [Dichotomosiphon tuberosus]